MEEKRRKRKVSEASSSGNESDLLASKTSAEILNELFGSFAAFDDELMTDYPAKKAKKEKKKKKDKHKHKHKEKDKDRDKDKKSSSKDKEKHRKKDRKSSSSNSSRRVSIADDQSLGIKVEVCKDKLSELKENSLSPAKVTEDPPFYDHNLKYDIDSPIEPPDIDLEKERSPELPSIVSKNIEEESTEVFEKQEVKPTSNDIGLIIGPSKGRIQIKSLKTSAVFEQTIREIEEEAKKRAEKFEEGELTPSSSSHNGGSTSPSLCDVELPPRPASPFMSLSKDMPLKGKDDEVEKEKKPKRSHGHKSSDKDGKKRDKSPSRSHDKRSKDGKKHDSSKAERHRSRSHERERRRETQHRSTREGRSYRGERHRSRSRERDRDRDKRGGRRGSSRDRDRRGRRGSESQYSKSRGDRPDDGERIDKRKLLAIARRNAMYLLREQQERMIQAGVMPGDSTTTALPVDAQGGKTVAELTEYCKQLVKSKSMSGSSDEDSDISLSDGEGPTESFIHHPFTLRDRPNAIVMNIRNSTQLPTRSMQEKAAESSKMRSLQFPVSSGQQHRSNEWVPVSPKKTETETPSSTENAEKNKSKALVATDVNQIVDIGSIISQKLSAIRKMQETTVTNPATPGPGYGYGYGFGQNPPLGWESGQFTGTTGAKVLTPAELASGQQAWARKDQLRTAAPVAGGMGMKLLQKMGWRPGEGLGKNKEGSLEPLKLDVKMDKKGLVAQEEVRQRFQPFQPTKGKKGGGGGGGGSAPAPTGGGEVFSGKHPVSALVELCTKRHWGAPTFEVVFESGPDHKKNFVFKVIVNNRDYQPNVACGNKKQAKAMAAQNCLEQLGLIVKMPPS